MAKRKTDAEIAENLRKLLDKKRKEDRGQEASNTPLGAMYERASYSNPR